MSDNSNFNFCPHCGALMQNGVCQSCGRGARRNPLSGDYYAQNPNEQPQMQQGGFGTGVSNIFESV